jgi:3-deoxy-D-manno-octulosonic-acid transferase
MPGILRTLYGAVWDAALPALYCSKRLRSGFRQRLVPSHWVDGPADIWIQAASGGEAYLAWELVKHLDLGRPSRLLLTTGTTQGMEILVKTEQWSKEHQPEMQLLPHFFPFDSPRRMRRAMQQARPRALVLLETELWPGLLVAAAEENVPVLVVNGRMTKKSLRRYRLMEDFFREVRPERILAVSKADAARFAALFGSKGVGVMDNIKLDRMAEMPVGDNKANPLCNLLDPAAPFIVLGSVRRQEEPSVLRMIQALRRSRPDVVIGLFPRHMHRLESWDALLKEARIPCLRRTTLTAPPAPGTVILWDVFGELGAAYGQAQAAFVGGSLKPLGGQNFLEPLASGVVPCIGPHWDNFHWIGEDIFPKGLAHRGYSSDQVASQLLLLLEHPAPRQKVIACFQNYLSSRRGGTAQACKLIKKYTE